MNLLIRIIVIRLVELFARPSMKW